MEHSQNKKEQSSITFDTQLNTQIKAGLVLFLLLFGLGGIWASTAPIDGAAIATGKVMVRSYSKTVQHLEGGIITNIFVQDGARVAEGDPILNLDNTQSLGQLELARSQLLSLSALEYRLVAEREGLPELTYPNELLSRSDQAKKEADAQTEIFKARRSSLGAGIDVLSQRINQLQSQISGMQGLQKSRALLSTSYQEELEDVEMLLGQGFSDKNRLRELQRNVAQLDGEIAELISEIAAAEIQIGESQLQIIQRERDFHNEVVTELADVQTNSNDAIERVTVLEDIVSRTIVRAPDSGLVNGLQVHTIGGVISPGMRIVDIVPETDDLIVEARVLPIDVDRVIVGQEATIRFSTFGGGAVPTVFGELISVSADSFQDQVTGAPYYLARVEVSDNSLADLGDLTLIPGMPADVFIKTGSRTLFEYLLKPFSNAMARGLRED